MTIQLNDQPLDVTIAEGETLGQVVRDLESWLSGGELVLCSVLLGQRELLSLPEEQWAGTPQGEVGTLQVTVKPARELAAQNLQTVAEYLDLLAANLAPDAASPAGKPGLTGGLLDGLAPMAQSLARHFPESLPELQALEAVLRGPTAGADPRQALALIQRLRERVRLRLGEMEDPREALRLLAGSLARCIPEVSEVSILLQTGRNRQAMGVVLRFSELLQDLLRVVGRELPDASIEGRTLPAFCRELNAVLAELIEAFQARDSVLIGDLMEYEMAPRLQTLRAFLDEHRARSQS